MEHVTLITGGSSGIGAATARALLQQGHRVAVTGRDGDRLAAFAASADAGEQLLTVSGDAGDATDVASVVNEVIGRWGRLDTVIANAGFSLPGTLEDHDPEAMRAMVLTNVLGPALLVRQTLPYLRESKGRIVVVGSVAGIRNTPGNLYSVTKWAVHALVENVRLLVAKDRVGVTLVAPGVVDTPFWDERGGSPQAAPALTAEHIANAILFAVNQPEGVDVSQLVVRPTGQLG
ncbi:short-chain dehydrogenase/reductase SDR [Catenulispora acidiphila DSM 44928]|uniref:Short-chain dehydrogenase/reductase SDR n=1 Tax=Catenulispora acidiphila (strain DSM 44928 / JCM 14897 / NBRC 102108 / NRRL B-24433 / ID139908) TaxID=479433 RepID=C7Q7J4_CATAD|nr:SDR family oxidoreductase [Catenulispora acidiphila]ACU72187.1 short-chain dehydrogenase/reductase SDR [Catenulispora acidiphila DSM 44928]